MNFIKSIQWSFILLWFGLIITFSFTFVNRLALINKQQKEIKALHKYNKIRKEWLLEFKEKNPNLEIPVFKNIDDDDS